MMKFGRSVTSAGEGEREFSFLKGPLSPSSHIAQDSTAKRADLVDGGLEELGEEGLVGISIEVILEIG